MKTDIFPHSYKELIEKEADKKKNAVNSQYWECSEKIKKELGSSNGDNISLTFFLAGMPGGLFACFWTLGEANSSIGRSLGMCIAVFAAACILGSVIGSIMNAGYNKRWEEANARLEEEEKQKNQKCDAIDAEAQRKIAEYPAAFEKNAQRLSTQFAESELAKNLVEEMSAEFISTIRCGYRPSTDTHVTIPFSMKVYYNKISWIHGEYDFYQNRCRELSSHLEQAALAIAIVSQVQLNAMMAMPLEDSDVSPSVQISYSYADAYAEATITYTAVNGRYVAVKNW